MILKGWVDHVRDIGNLKFFLLRVEGKKFQVTAKKGIVTDEILGLVSRLNREDCVIVEGEMKEAKQAPGGKELIPTKIEITSESETPLPIEIEGDSGKDKRLDYRFMDLRNPKTRAIFTLKSKAYSAMRKFLEENATEVQTPVIQAAGAEGGSSLFPLIYYGKEAFLRQSPQLYKQIMMASGLNKIWEVGSTFRAEKFHTRRHTSEITMVDFEMAWVESEEDAMKVLEGLVHHILKSLSKDAKEELDVLGVKLKVPKLPFKRVTYDEALELVEGKTENKLKWGDDLGDPEEKVLGEILEKEGHEIYFLTKYPSQIKPFYIMMDGKYSRGFDLDYKGMEVSSGGQREHRIKELEKLMKAKGLDPHKFDFYLNAFRYGMPSHSGFGFGIDRLLMQALNLPDIKEVILFPRTTERLMP